MRFNRSTANIIFFWCPVNIMANSHSLNTKSISILLSDSAECNCQKQRQASKPDAKMLLSAIKVGHHKYQDNNNYFNNEE